MEPVAESISPKRAAQAMGVSESSLKRWCDQGRIRIVRTAGGHRKLSIADLLQFVRDNNQPLVAPELLGLEPITQRTAADLSNMRPRLVEALLAGEESMARQIIQGLYLAKQSLAGICDELIAPAFREIGERWACNDAEVYQERRACEIARRLLYGLRRLQPPANAGWTAMGGTLEGDQYALPSAMAELVLREAGYQAVALGSSIPLTSLLAAIEQGRPSIFWLSVSDLRDGGDFLSEFNALSHQCQDHHVALVVGGRALTPELRQHMSYSAFCDTMQHLDRFARTLAPTLDQRPLALRSSNESSPVAGDSTADE